MDDYDAYLYSIDDTEIEEGESDNDVLDNIDEEQAPTSTAVVLVPASSPTRERESGDEKQLKPCSTTSKLITRCNRFVHVSLSLAARALTMHSRVLTESACHTSGTFSIVYLSS